MRAAHNNGRPSGGWGLGLMQDRTESRALLVHLVEVMHVTGKGRTWHQEGDDWLSSDAANAAAQKLRAQGWTVRTRPVIRNDDGSGFAGRYTG